MFTYVDISHISNVLLTETQLQREQTVSPLWHTSQLSLSPVVTPVFSLQSAVALRDPAPKQ